MKNHLPMTQKIKIYLDDVRIPTEGDWIVAKDYYEFISLIETYGLNNIELISLDHDLGDTAMVEYYNNVKDNYTLDYNNIREMTGYDCCKFLVDHSIDNNVPLPLIRVHSANPIGSHNMMGYINNYLKNRHLPLTCVHQNVEHIIDENFKLSPEAREAKWKRINK
jgi:hypothetical protein